MEQREIFQLKLKSFQSALKGFEQTLNIDISAFDDEVKEAVKNGRIQKFEYCTEMTWKIIKRYLENTHGIETKSPKQAIKEFYLINSMSEQDYETLLGMIDDRNRLSHIYKEEFFQEILSKLPAYLAIMKKVNSFASNE